MSKKFFFFLVIGLILASPGWYLVTIQLKYVSIEEGLFFRFLLAAGFLEIVRRSIKQHSPPTISKKIWGLIILQGLFLFGINFWLCYEASKHMISGLIPVLAAVIFVPAMIIERFTKQCMIPNIKIIGSFIAVFGIFLLFYQDILAVQRSHLYGLLLAFFSTFFTLGGTQIARTLIQQHNIPSIWLTSRALLCGSLFFLFLIFFEKGLFEFSLEGEFIYSLLYLSFGVTGVIYLLHTSMIKAYGLSTASFLWTLVPGACLTISAIFEGYNWTLSTTLGLFLIIVGATLNYGNLNILKTVLKQG